MAERVSLEQAAAQWDKGRFHPVYLFAGPDALQKEDALKRLREKLLGPDESGLNVDRFDGDAASAGEILTAVQTLPFLGGRRLVLVRRAHDMPAAETNRLADALPSLPPTNCLVLLWDEKADARHALVQAVNGAGLVLTFWTPFENQLPRWARDRARALGKALSWEAAQALVEAVGGNTQDLSQELEKLALYVGDRAEIGVDDLEGVTSEGRPLQFMELDRALWRRDRLKTLELAEILRAQGEGPEALLPQIARSYRRLLLGKALLAEKKTDVPELWNQLRIRSRDTQAEFLEATRSRSWEELLEVLERLLRAEQDLKTGRGDPDANLTLLLSWLTEERRGGLAGGGRREPVHGA